MQDQMREVWHATTILSVRRGKDVVIAGDGQVSLGNSVIKSTANKIKKIGNGTILTGFAGSTADAFTLFDMLESKLQQYSNKLLISCVEMAKDWRGDKFLRKLEAMMIVADKDVTLILTGNGDVLEPEHGIAAIGSGGNYALSAARALIDIETISLEEIAKKSMNIAADLCIYTNNNIIIDRI